MLDPKDIIKITKPIFEELRRDAMSEFMFGVVQGKTPRTTARKWDRICREEGGYGFSQIDESHGTSDGGRWLGWFSGPNRGEPFDSDLSKRVLERSKTTR